MLRCLFALLLVQVALGSVPRKYLRDDDDLSGVDPDILDGLDDYDEEAERVKQELIDQYARGIGDTIKSTRYPFEAYAVETEDGYILGVHRIPYSPVNGPASNKPVVFLQHGLLCSSNDWIIPGPGKGLAYLLADLGYDVWMGNARGNSFSKNHKKLSPKKKDFWDFSWHQIGYYDLPAMIDYILGATGQSSLNYVGHSQGTTSFFIMTSLRPEYNSKIRAMHALAPVAFMSNMANPFFQVIAPLLSKVSVLNKLLGTFEFLPSSKLLSLVGSALCKDESHFQAICSNFLFLLAGFDDENLNATMIPDIVKVTPAGASVNQILHYAQGCNSGHFRQYDYGSVKNLLKYKSLSPPDYPLTKVTAPIHLYYANNDWMAAVKDVQILASKLPNLVYNKMVPHKKFNHLDFLWAINVYDLLYADLIENIEKYT